ncbi:MFS transporter [Pseudonocardia sp. CA-107938]|uniref:MFS transporter n=1 Tax=Pseudonocardia sp. CA-107938 TaxID=3240021 RepID=UPI003D89EC60
MSSEIVEPPGSHEPVEYAKTPKKAAASGWIGSALEYYDFFIYAQAAALVFPLIFFPSNNPQVAIVASFATFGVGYVARPIGAFVLGHWGDTHGRKNVLVLCMLMMGVSTFAVALLPTYATAGIWAPILLVVLRLIQGFAVGGEISGASAMIIEHAPFGRRGYFGSFTLQGVQAGQVLAAAVFLPLSAAMSAEAFQSWGWRIPFLLSALVVVAGYIIRRRVDETPAFKEEAVHGALPKAPIVQAVRENGLDMFRVICMALMNAIPTAVTVFGATFATNAGYGVGLTSTNYLWISVVGNVVAVILIPFVGNLSDRIGRRPVMIVGCLGSGILGYFYLYFVSQANIVLAFVFAMLMWGIVYQGYNAVFPAFYQELFPTRTRVTAFAISQNIGTLITAFLPTIYAALVGPTPSACVVDKKFAGDVVLPSGQTCRAAADAIETSVVWTVGSFTLGLAIIAAIAAYSARETFRVHLNDLGRRDAPEVPREEYDRLRAAV